MSGGRWKIELDGGATFRAAFRLSTRVTTDDGDTDEPWDLTGLAFALAVRDGRGVPGTQVYPLTVADDRVELELTPEQTAGYVPHNRYLFTLDCTFPSGEVRRVLEGPMYVRATR